MLEASKVACKAEAITNMAQAKKEKRNSVTMPVEWAAFGRTVANRKKFPVELASHYTHDKTDLFALWLDNDKDFEK